jgi:hypothetical protein
MPAVARKYIVGPSARKQDRDASGPSGFTYVPDIQSGRIADRLIKLPHHPVGLCAQVWGRRHYV